MKTTNNQLTEVQIIFEHQGKTRFLNKHPVVQAAVRNGTMTPAEALNKPWFFRLNLRDGSRKTFKLTIKDADSIRQAKQYIDANGTSEFQDFLKDRSAKNSAPLGKLAEEWEMKGFPNPAQRPRDEDKRASIKCSLDAALEFFKDITAASATKSVINEFATWRRNKCKQTGRGTGDRSIDVELSALSCLCDWAVSMEKIEANPFAARPKYQRKQDVTHCHEFMPDSDEQWHQILRHLFTYTYGRKAKNSGKGAGWAKQDAAYTSRLRIIGGWLAFTGLTGLRPEEPQFLYRFPTLAQPPGNPSKLAPGTIFPTVMGEHKMKIQRGKNGQNPYVTIHPALANFLAHWNAWLDETFGTASDKFPRSLFPNPEDQTQCLFSDGDFTPLIRRLEDACEIVGAPRLKPKGFGRAYYVRVRRSQDADDSLIASELGQTTNGQLIRTTYGDPADLKGAAAFDWLPNEGKPAWHLLSDIETATTSNIIQISSKS